MTDSGYKDLMERIINRTVEIPNNAWKLESVQSWLEGYAKCQLDILDIIDNLRKVQER